MNFKARLSRKFLIAIGIVIAIFIATLFGILQHQSNKDLTRTLDDSAQKALSEVMFTRAWIVNHDGGFVRRGVEESDAASHKTSKESALRSSVKPFNEIDYSKLDHALVTQDLLNFSNKKNQYKLQSMSLDFDVPGYKLTEFDRKNLDAFKKDPAIIMNRSAVAREEVGGVELYRKLIPLRVERGCLNCHPNLHTGQVVGGLSVSVPVTDAKSKVMLGNVVYTSFGLFVIAVILGLVY